MRPRKSKSHPGWLDIFFYVAVLLVVVISVIGGWTLNIAIALVMLVAVYAVLRDVSALRQVNARNERSPSSDALTSLQRSSRGSRVLQQPRPMANQHHESRRVKDQAVWAQRTTQPK